MKKLILIVLVLAMGLPVMAQNDSLDFRRHEISIGYGFHPASGFGYYFGTFASYDVDYVGAFYGAYTYFFNKHVGIGGTYCFDPRKMSCYYYGTDSFIADLDESCHSLMGHLKINCVNREHFTFYTKFDAGICFWNYKLIEYQTDLFQVVLPKNHCCFAWNLATGIEVGNQHIAGFMQVGIGMEGSFSLGIRYKFNNKAK